MTPADMPTALRLTEQAGWNQKQADWQRFLELEPCGCFAAEWKGLPAGLTVTCVFGPVAWIAMVLVDDSLRRRGIATALLHHALAFLEEQGVRTIRLDATDMGKGVYEPLGFVTDFRVTRYEGTARSSRIHPQVLKADADHFPDVAVLDARAAGADRGRYLERLGAESPQGTCMCCQAGRMTGFIMTRPGAHALQVGPCVASPQAGPLLLEDMVHRCAGRPVCVDVPSDHAAAVGVVEALGLTARRHFTRMYRGLCPVGERMLLWCSSGPEKG